MYNPDQILFASCNTCNLSCAHCFTNKANYSLNFVAIESFLRDAVKSGITTFGFSGGEPFLQIDFLLTAIDFALQNDCVFDTIITNGVWFQNQQDLRVQLQKLYNAGYDGTFSISIDNFHKTAFEKTSGESYIAKIILFCNTIFELWHDREIIRLVTVIEKSVTDKKSFEILAQLATTLGGTLFSTKNIPASIHFTNRLNTRMIYENHQTDHIVIQTIDYTPENYLNEKYWQETEWFTEDFCAGPGQVLYIHPNGDLAACCGYANEHKRLCLGNCKTDSFSSIKQKIQAITENDFLYTVYCSGLRARAEQMEQQGHCFPSKRKTKNTCLFCRYLLGL